MKKPLGITIVLVLALSLAPAAGQAAKAGGKKSCPKQAFCLWTKANYRGKKLVITKKGLDDLPAAFNDEVSSLKTKYTENGLGLAFLFEKKDGKGSYRCFGGDDFSKVPDLSTPNWDFDNQASSAQLPKNDGPSCN